METFQHFKGWLYFKKSVWFNYSIYTILKVLSNKRFLVRPGIKTNTKKLITLLKFLLYNSYNLIYYDSAFNISNVVYFN